MLPLLKNEHYWDEEKLQSWDFIYQHQTGYLEALGQIRVIPAGTDPQRFKRLSLTCPMLTVSHGDFACCACSPCSVSKWIPIDLERFNFEYE